MFGTLAAVPENLKVAGQIVDIHDVNGGTVSYMYDGVKWIDYCRPDRPKTKRQY